MKWKIPPELMCYHNLALAIVNSAVEDYKMKYKPKKFKDPKEMEARIDSAERFLKSSVCDFFLIGTELDNGRQIVEAIDKTYTKSYKDRMKEYVKNDNKRISKNDRKNTKTIG